MRVTTGMLALALAAALPGSAGAQMPLRLPPGPPAATTAAPPADLLAGPTVQESQNDPAQPPFARMQQGNRRGLTVPPDRWARAYRALPLGAEQQRAARRIAVAFERERRAYQEGPGRELRRLRRQRRAMDDGSAREAVTERIRGLKSQRPRFEPVQRALWELLTPEQQSVFDERLDEEKAAMVERRRERRAREERKAVRDGG